MPESNSCSDYLALISACPAIRYASVRMPLLRHALFLQRVVAHMSEEPWTAQVTCPTPKVQSTLCALIPLGYR